MPTPEQIAELDAIIAELKAHPEKHDQKTYIVYRHNTPKPPIVTVAMDCGSAFCIAGAAVVRAGYLPVFDTDYRESLDVNDTGEYNCWSASACVSREGGFSQSISRVAAQVLGLTDVQADALFHAYNTMDDIQRIRNAIVAGRGMT